MDLFFVTEGKVSSVDYDDVDDVDAQTDWISSILVIARDESEALEAADLYDKRLIDGDGCYWPNSYGKLIKCIDYTQFKEDLYEKRLIDGDKTYWPDKYAEFLKCIDYSKFEGD